MNWKVIDLLFTVGIIAKVAMLSFVMAIRKMRLFILTGGGEVSAMAIFYFPALDSDGGDDPYVLYGMGIGIRPPKAGDTKIYMLKYLSLELSGQLAVNTDFTINVGAKNIGNAESYGSVDMARDRSGWKNQEAYQYAITRGFNLDAKVYILGISNAS